MLGSTPARRAAALLAVLACAGCGGPTREAAQRQACNIVLILADDLGWRDVGYNGSEFYRTPRIDALARAGMVFTNAYAAHSICKPSRLGLLTGRYPARVSLSPQDEEDLESYRETGFLGGDLGAPTLADYLKAAGYAVGLVGKWHEDAPPDACGFDSWIGGSSSGMTPSYFSPWRLPNLEDGAPGEYLTDRLTDEAIAFLRAHRDRRFFLFLSHYAPHSPWEAKAERIAQYQARADPSAPQRNPVYAAMIDSLDEGVGRVVAELETLGIADRTVVVFTSDNGGFVERRASAEHPAAYYITSNAPLRSGKGRLYEGGLRVPFVVVWPGVVAPGSSSDFPTVSLDLVPTFLALLGLERATGLDGVDLGTLLAGGPAPPRDTLCFHMPRANQVVSAIRKGDEKLIHYHDGNRSELYDLAADPGETTDLVTERSERAEVLRTELFRWLDEVVSRPAGR